MDIDFNKIRRLDSSLLLVFVELVRHERTTVVAQRMGLSQSAISHALTRLREVFGDPLFTRRPDGLTPTSRTLELAPKILEIVRLTQEAVSGRSGFDAPTSGRIFRLAANDLVATLFGTPLIADLAERAPGARLAFRFAVGKAAFDALRTDQIDLALGRFYDIPSGFASAPLSVEPFAVVARSGHPRTRDGIDLETFLDLDHVLVSFAGRLSGAVDAELARLGLARRVRASVPMFLTAFAAVAASDMIATVPARLAAGLASGFGLRVYAPPIAIEGFPLSLVRHPASRGDAGVDWLAARIGEVAGGVA